MSVTRHLVRKTRSASRIPQPDCNTFIIVYVISPSSDVYHLPAEPEDRTLCGLSLAPIIINRPVKKASTLYLTEIKPAERRLCEECAEVKARPSDVKQGRS